MLMAEDMNRAVEFYSKTLGFDEGFLSLLPDPEGNIIMLTHEY